MVPQAVCGKGHDAHGRSVRDEWASMTFDGVLARGIDLLQRHGRVSYRALKADSHIIDASPDHFHP